MLCVMDTVNNPGPTLLAMKVCGVKEKLMVTVNFSMPMEIFMKENGWTIRLMVWEPTLMLTELNTTESGETINSMEQDVRPGLTAPFTKENIMKERRTVKESSLSLTNLSIKESSK